MHKHLETLLATLKEFGLTETEAQLYAYLLPSRPQSYSALEIATALQLPRTSVYDNLLKLCERGFVQRVLRHKTLHFTANSVDFFDVLVQAEKDKAARLGRIAEHIKVLASTSTAHRAETQVRYYHGEQGLMQVMWNTLAAKGETIGYGSLGRFKVLRPAFIQRLYDEFVRRQIRDRVIIRSTPQTMQYLSVLGSDAYRQTFREARVFPDTLHVTGDVTIYNDIFSISHWEQEEMVAVEIQNYEFVKSQKSIFELLWRSALPVARYLQAEASNSQ